MKKQACIIMGQGIMPPWLCRFISVDPLQDKYPEHSPYVYCANNPVKYIDPDGREIKGATKSDAEKMRTDLLMPLSDTDSKFDKFKQLVTTKGKSLKSIEEKDYQKAFENVTLSEDEKAYTELLYNTINSEQTHTIEYVDKGSYISNAGASVLESYLNTLPEKDRTEYMLLGRQKQTSPSFDENGNRLADTVIYKWTSSIIETLGGGLALPNGNDSYSFVINNLKSDTQVRALNTIHELLGHGVAFSNSLNQEDNNANAIRTENLARRLFGIPDTQRNGLDHADKKVVENHEKLPLTK